MTDNTIYAKPVSYQRAYYYALGRWHGMFGGASTNSGAAEHHAGKFAEWYQARAADVSHLPIGRVYARWPDNDA